MSSGYIRFPANRAKEVLIFPLFEPRKDGQDGEHGQLQPRCTIVVNSNLSAGF